MQAVSTFSRHSDRYRQSRPHYPAALFAWILRHVPATTAAWDCATGNGQAAISLSPYFQHIQATDVSAQQIEQAETAPNIQYSVQPAEASGFAERSFDLVAVAQALHWFDFPRFWNEVRRVSRADALFCAWAYGWFECDTDVDQGLVQPLRELIQPFWAPNNQLIWDGYPAEQLAFPFERMTPPPLAIELEWSLPQLIAYLQTWSSYKRAQEQASVAARLDALVRGALARHDPRRVLAIRMPLTVLAGRVAR